MERIPIHQEIKVEDHTPKDQAVMAEDDGGQLPLGSAREMPSLTKWKG